MELKSGAGPEAMVFSGFTLGDRQSGYEFMLEDLVSTEGPGELTNTGPRLMTDYLALVNCGVSLVQVNGLNTRCQRLVLIRHIILV